MDKIGTEFRTDSRQRPVSSIEQEISGKIICKPFALWLSPQSFGNIQM
ncbi:hypothetical protein [Phocaeicola faecalis]|nr:hypothetical protein [Phocaeicola faecalis]